jgi:hypothetical protein
MDGPTFRTRTILNAAAPASFLNGPPADRAEAQNAAEVKNCG